jgi:hypothetical protein
MAASRALRLALVVISGLLLGAPAWGDDQWAPFLGVWEYRQRNPAAPGGVDPQGERLDIRRRGAAVVGLYFGLEREGEHGLFYTATAVTGLSVDDQGTLSFIVPARHLFTERPASVEAASRKSGASSGFTRAELKMRGRLRNGRLTLMCVAEEPRDCPDQELAFSRIRPGGAGKD